MRERCCFCVEIGQPFYGPESVVDNYLLLYPFDSFSGGKSRVKGGETSISALTTQKNCDSQGVFQSNNGIPDKPLRPLDAFAKNPVRRSEMDASLWVQL